MKKVYLLLIALITISILPASWAVVVPAEVRDTPQQDLLIDHPGEWHEIGIGFPEDERIEASFEETSYIPCHNDYQGGQNYLVTIRNMSQTTWTNLHYVADPETSFSNDDGEAQDLNVNGWTLAFRIDNTGVNTNLIFESMAQDNRFEPGEVWRFVVQEYSNSQGLNPDQLNSWDGVNQGQISHASSGPPSSASIIAIPEPNVIVLVLMTGSGLLFIRRKFMM